MSHENSITIQRPDGHWVNIKGNVKGKFDPKKAESLYRSGKRKSLDGVAYPTVESAVEAAKKRSKSYKP